MAKERTGDSLPQIKSGPWPRRCPLGLTAATAILTTACLQVSCLQKPSITEEMRQSIIPSEKIQRVKRGGEVFEVKKEEQGKGALASAVGRLVADLQAKQWKASLPPPDLIQVSELSRGLVVTKEATLEPASTAWLFIYRSADKGTLLFVKTNSEGVFYSAYAGATKGEWNTWTPIGAWNLEPAQLVPSPYGGNAKPSGETPRKPGRFTLVSLGHMKTDDKGDLTEVWVESDNTYDAHSGQKASVSDKQAELIRSRFFVLDRGELTMSIPNVSGIEIIVK